MVREYEEQEVDAEEVVIGDIVVLKVTLLVHLHFWNGRSSNTVFLRRSGTWSQLTVESWSLMALWLTTLHSQVRKI